MRPPDWVPAAAAGAVVALALPSGGLVFGVAVVVAAGVALTEVSRALAAVTQRPVLLAAAAAGLGAPAVLTVTGAPGWDQVAGVMAAGVLASFVIVLLTPRAQQAVAVLAATLLCGLLVGLGAAALVILRTTGAGFRWTAGLLALTVVPEIAAAVTARWRPGGAGDDPGAGPLAARVVAAGAVTGALLMVANPPFGPLVAGALAAIGLLAGAAGRRVGDVVVPTPGADAQASGERSGPRAGVRWLVPTLLAAPVGGFLALALQV